MTFVASEIASQPSVWEQTGSVSLAGLPAAGERVAVLGCGTSYFMAQAYAALRESAGQGETDAWPASEFPAGRRYDRVVAFTRSGTTTEVLAALSRASAPTVVLTASPSTPVASVAGTVISLPFADERSVVQTRFATAVLVLLRAHLGESVASLPAAASAALSSSLSPALSSASQFTFIGSGWAVGVAHEAALKLREAAQVWTESYYAMEYRHGPVSIAAPGRVVWIFGSAPDGLLAELGATGVHVEHSGLDPVVDLVRVQRVAVELATGRGLNPDAPRHLDRSVILT